MLGTLRRSGNSVVVTIPPDELDHAGVHEGDMVDVQIRPVEVRPKLTPRLEATARRILARPGTAVALARLADG